MVANATRAFASSSDIEDAHPDRCEIRSISPSETVQQVACAPPADLTACPEPYSKIPDDLSHGPLDDGCARVDYMRACFRGYDDWLLDVTDAFAPWREVIEWLDEDKRGAILIWSGENVSEATFLAMARSPSWPGNAPF